ncbi:bifunctional acetate--CoA ligase family protein/GNAT family N-acetyltransferase [Adonisia turfae]|uniref:GNAT family N-acetyltransferase n=1 Tax=Adonisia turfae CCMR0081 TaxID=2292702 RepID=A0A6M0RTH9_9CYAN|nr:bifunctional acetate--CoA ligase family protein/GNAT family N-acetyltransferase [Adonisia turfae]NEZ59062.1 GNAT family N-acetyltransferase [Adonisia turfae CCMR0081]
MTSFNVSGYMGETETIPHKTDQNSLQLDQLLCPDPAHDILRYDYQPLSPFFAPQTVAVIGATERPGSVGRTVLWNLISSSFGGTVFPVHPTRTNVLGIKAYPTIGHVPEQVDLAIIAIPAQGVPAVIEQCGIAGVAGVIILSAGFREVGEAGAALEAAVLATARRHQLRVLGPNCLGLMCPISGLNATFAGTMANPGSVGFISQSGALCTSILDWSLRENVGFSAFVSIGSMLDIDWGDLIYYLGDDPATHSIVIYMETIGNARSFLSAAREVALSKPIIVIKSGRTQLAAQAAASHTGAMAGSDEVLDAAFRRCGVLRVNTIDELFNLAEVLGKQPRPRGKRLTILTNAGGPGVLATDALIRSGGELASLSAETVETLDTLLPDHWSRQNPIDILGDATPERYGAALDVLAQDRNSDGLLVILTPQAMTQPAETAAQLQSRVGHWKDRPLLASWMGTDVVATGEARLNQSSIFTLPYPDAAAQVFTLMARYSDNLHALYETPSLTTTPTFDTTPIGELLTRARAEHRLLLSEWESKALLNAYGIPTVTTKLATSVDEAVTLAEHIGYPVVLKLHSHTITHKTDVGGVQLNLPDAMAVRAAYRSIMAIGQPGDCLGVTVQPMVLRNGYELILGSSVDEQLGPVLLFGSGGQLVEVYCDRALGLPPLNTTLARRLMEKTQIYKALKGVRGQPSIDLAALEQLLVRFSQLVVAYPEIKEIEINPLLASAEQLLALDARVVLHESDIPEDQLPKPAIRPYPKQYIKPWALPDGMGVTIRPISPEDEPLIVDFHKTLSEESIYFRYFHLINLKARVAHERLTRICFIDYDREMALVAEYHAPATQQRTILGVARLSRLHGLNEAEFGMLINDQYQGRGLGTELLRSLINIGQAEELTRISADILPENQAMQHLCKKLGFTLQRDQGELRAYLDL